MRVYLILFLLLTTSTIFYTKALEIVRIINVAENLALDIDKGTEEGKKVVLWDTDSGAKWQRWIVDINGAKYGTPSTFQSLDQDGIGRLKVLDEERSTNNLIVWGNYNSSNQKWYFIWASAPNNYLMVNQATSRCLYPNGRSNQVSTVPCNSGDTKQHWRIENFSQVTYNWQEHWGHIQNLEIFFGDNDVTIYYDKDMDRTITWMNQFTGDVWRYSKHTYGNFGPDPRLYAVFHQNKYGGGHPAYFYSSNHDNRNVIDIGQSGSWANPQGWNIDVIVHEICHIVESTTKGYEGSPAFGIWGDSKWGDIFGYDVYKGIGQLNEAKRVYDMNQNVYDNYPRNGTQWFKNWFWPIYANYGETSVLVRFFDTLIAHWPKRGFSYSGGMNIGEFVHFWSGAAKTNLKTLASNTFGWTSVFESEYQAARNKFPGIIY